MHMFVKDCSERTVHRKIVLKLEQIGLLSETIGKEFSIAMRKILSWTVPTIGVLIWLKKRGFNMINIKTAWMVQRISVCFFECQCITCSYRYVTKHSMFSILRLLTLETIYIAKLKPVLNNREEFRQRHLALRF